jgi:hypothetical protein
MRTKIYFTDSYHSLIKGKLKVADGYKEGFFIIDTACTHCLINSVYCDEKSHHLNNTCNSITAGNVSKESKLYEFSYTIEDDNYSNNFQEIENLNAMIGNSSIPLLGLLGLSFLWKNKMVVDYNIGEIYTLEPDFKLNVEDLHFCFSLAYGLENWRLPVVGITNDKNEDLVVAMVDTGSNSNIMCKPTLEEFKYENTGKIDEVTYISGQKKNTISKVQFYILSAKGQKLDYQEKSAFFSISELEYLLKEKDNSISCILGNLFLLENKMTIDFKNCIIYA